MPVHDLTCPRCPTIQTNRWVPLRKLATPRVAHGFTSYHEILWPPCPACGTPMEALPPRVRMDFDATHGETVEIQQPDGSFRRVTLTSLSEIRRLERESEQRERDGEGQRMVWRDYSQDRSNADQHTLAAEAPERPVLSDAAKRRFGPSIRRSMEAPQVELGDGVDESMMSALEDR